MSRYNLNLLFFYLLNILFVLLSYYLDHLFIEKDKYIGFKYFLGLQVIYFLWWKLLKPNFKSKVHLIICGLFFIGTEPAFENDHYRYLWEGKVVKSAENPYKLAPNSKELNHVKFEKRKKISYNKLTTIYPPLAQAFFFIHSPFEYKYAFILMQLLGLSMLIYIIFNLFEMNKYLILIFPYLTKEFIQAVHIDILAVFTLLVFLRKNKTFLGIFFGFQAKILTILALPIYFLKGLFIEKSLLLKSIFTVFCIIATVYFYPIKLGYHSGASAFIQYWSWNSLTGLLLLSLDINHSYIRLIQLGFFSIAYFSLLVILFRNNFKNEKHIISISYLFLYAFTPVLHPWYLIWPVIWHKQNKWYYYLLFSSFLAYYSYGMEDLRWFAEIIQFSLIALCIKKNITDYLSRGAKRSI